MWFIFQHIPTTSNIRNKFIICFLNSVCASKLPPLFTAEAFSSGIGAARRCRWWWLGNEEVNDNHYYTMNRSGNDESIPLLILLYNYKWNRQLDEYGVFKRNYPFIWFYWGNFWKFHILDSIYSKMIIYIYLHNQVTMWYMGLSDRGDTRGITEKIMSTMSQQMMGVRCFSCADFLVYEQPMIVR